MILLQDHAMVGNWHVFFSVSIKFVDVLQTKMALTVTQVLDVLKDENISFFEDSTVSTINHAIEKTPKDTICVITSTRAFEEYDRDNPCRIVCILATSTHEKVLLMVNNRQMHDLRGVIMRWLSHPKAVPSRKEKPECTICTIPIWYRKQGATRVFASCWNCHKIMCGKCNERIYDHRIPGYKCPTCTTWNLHGDNFGTPHDLLEVPQGRDIISCLDGHIQVYVKIGKQMSARPVENFCVRTICPIPEEAMDREVSLYVLRKTWRIQEGLPVMEHALIEVGDDGKIHCTDPESWQPLIDVKSMYPNMTVLRVAYGDAWNPPQLPASLTEVMRRHKHKKTISVVGKRDAYMNFDADADGSPTSVTEPQLRRIVYKTLLGSHLFFACVRVFDQENPAYVVFKCDGNKVECLNAKVARAFYFSKRDEIIDMKRLTRFGES